MEKTGQVTYHLSEEEYGSICNYLKAIKNFYVDKDESWYDEEDVKHAMSKLEEIFNI